MAPGGLRIGRREFAPGLAAAIVFTAVPIEQLRAADGFAATADRVVVIKGDRQLMLLRGERVLRRFPISLGWNPVGHKLRRGDGRTPEGRYVLDGFNPDSDYYRSIHISYPNGVDRLRAARGPAGRQHHDPRCASGFRVDRRVPRRCGLDGGLHRGYQ